jgi:hypothetical protein
MARFLGVVAQRERPATISAREDSHGILRWVDGTIGYADNVDQKSTFTFF